MVEAGSKTLLILEPLPTSVPMALAKNRTKTPPPLNHLTSQVTILLKDYISNLFFKSSRRITIITLSNIKKEVKAPLFHNLIIFNNQLLCFFITIINTKIIKPILGG
jgi:hypothetical protein